MSIRKIEKSVSKGIRQEKINLWKRVKKKKKKKAVRGDYQKGDRAEEKVIQSKTRRKVLLR